MTDKKAVHMQLSRDVVRLIDHYAAEHDLYRNEATEGIIRRFFSVQVGTTSNGGAGINATAVNNPVLDPYALPVAAQPIPNTGINVSHRGKPNRACGCGPYGPHRLACETRQPINPSPDGTL